MLSDSLLKSKILPLVQKFALVRYVRLRHIPSPSIFASTSYLWLARSTYSGKQYWIHRDLHKKYDPLVRIGPNEITTDDPEILKKIASTSSDYSRATWYLTGRFNPYHDNLFTILEPKPHKRIKDRSMPAYLGRDTPGLEIIINQYVEKLVDVLRERYLAPQPGQQDSPLLNLSLITNFFTMDVITKLGFGHEIGYLRDEKDHYNFLSQVHSLWPQMSTSADVPWIREILFSTPFLKLLGPKHTDKKGFGALMGAAKEHVDRRFDSGEKEKHDMLESFMKQGLTRAECEAEALFLLLSGTESTACAIRQILVYAITNPSVYSKLKEEVASACRDGNISYPIRISEAKKLPYLQAVIYEGIRMRPPLLGLFPKVVPAPGETFHGKFIPAGTAICTNGASLQRSKALFGPDADVYNPERFMALESPEIRKKMEMNVELVFGYGQWMCAGKTIAFMELNKVVFELFRAFEMNLHDPMKPCHVDSYGVFVEKDLKIRLSSASTMF
ncbi:BcABA1 cytochrome P450 monooxygenase [Pyrenophora tritici-repentis]|nr:cytochrome P450 monooxygenase [Pyrenophora tritici-repentis]KAI2479369.1 BcABA1 cytochrome P450 monooxygenase [Pyrenophora tritici-repentis]